MLQTEAQSLYLLSYPGPSLSRVLSRLLNFPLRFASIFYICTLATQKKGNVVVVVVVGVRTNENLFKPPPPPQFGVPEQFRRKRVAQWTLPTLSTP